MCLMNEVKGAMQQHTRKKYVDMHGASEPHPPLDLLLELQLTPTMEGVDLFS